MITPRTPPDRAGVAAGLACYLTWGLLPLLFQAVERAGAGALEIVAWRTIFSLPLAALLVLGSRQVGVLRELGAKGVSTLTLSATLIAINWLTYVWAVTSGRTLEASLGYYINPLLNMAAGLVVFGERINRSGWIAMSFATAGVALQAAALGALPWTSLALAVSFCGYGIVRKRAAVPAATGLLVECVILSIPACAYVGWALTHGFAAFGQRSDASWLLALCGPFTVAPLACFVVAAQRLPLSLVGFIQFISPTLQFGVALLGGERLTPLSGLSFCFIWSGVIIFAVPALLRGPRERRTSAKSHRVRPQGD